MKKAQATKSLRIRSETVRALAAPDLAAAIGGILPTPSGSKTGAVLTMIPPSDPRFCGA